MNAGLENGGSGAVRARREVAERFVRAWGDMGALWGINRSTARVHALLLASAEPLTLDEIAGELQISRGNASMCLKELRSWGVAAKSSRPGDRKDYFGVPGDMWAVFYCIARERKRREFDPALATVRELVERLRAQEGKARTEGRGQSDVFRGRLAEMERFLSGLDRLAEALLASETPRRAFERLAQAARGHGGEAPR